jgi:hypothetical protein
MFGFKVASCFQTGGIFKISDYLKVKLKTIAHMNSCSKLKL